MPAPPPAAQPFDLADLIDLECRIAEDAAVDDEALRARDHAIAQTLDAGADDRPRLLSGWLAALRPHHPMPGARIARAVRLGRLALGIAGVLMGWGAGAWLMAYDGRTPVNVIHALAVLVGLQLGLLLLLGLGGLVRRLGGLEHAPGDLVAAGRAAMLLVDRLLMRGDAAWRAHDPDRRARWRAGWHRLRARRSLYRDVERWHAFGALQGFGVAFNLAALGAILTAVSLSDLAFAWATTLQIDAADFAGVVRALATPWVWLWPEAAPDVALVESTRYLRLESAYVGAADGRAPDPARVGDWWRFVVMATAVYGLLPRLGLWVWAKRRAGRALGRLPLDTPDVDRIVRRLTSHRVATRAPEPEQVVPPPARTLEPQYDPAPPKTPWLLVAWRDFPIDRARLRALVEGRYAGELIDIVEVADFRAEKAALSRLGGDGSRVLVLAETFEAPDKAVRRFLRGVREAVGERRPVVVGLVAEAEGGWLPVDRATLTLWQQHLAANEDPYLGVESVESAP